MARFLLELELPTDLQGPLSPDFSSPGSVGRSQQGKWDIFKDRSLYLGRCDWTNSPKRGETEPCTEREEGSWRSIRKHLKYAEVRVTGEFIREELTLHR